MPGVNKPDDDTETLKSGHKEFDWLILLIQFMGHLHVIFYKTALLVL